MKVSLDSSHTGVTLTCNISGTDTGSINCPLTLVSLPISSCGQWTASATATVGGQSATITATLSIACPTDTPTPAPATDTPTATATNPPAPATNTPLPPPPVQQPGQQPPVDAATPSKARPPATATATYLYPTQDHSGLPAGATVESDSPWIAFREVSGDAISNPTVRANAIEAVDVWGPLGVDARICFAGAGSLLLLDTAYSPRRLVWLASQQRDGQTCAQLDRAGTVALMPADLTATPTSRPGATATPDPHLVADSLEDRRLLVGCRVSASQLLNFRQAPAGSILSLYLGGSPAIARTDNWFQVMYLGNIGWISAHYVTTAGDCD